MSPLQQRELVLGAEFERARCGLYLPPREIPRDRPVGVDLFCGAGGFSCGFHQAGWHVAAAAEGWTDAARTYLVNLGGPGTRVHLMGDELPEGSKRDHAWFTEHRGQTVGADEFLAIGRGVDRAGLAGSGWISGRDDEPACEHFYLGDVRALTGDRLREDLARDQVAAVFGGPPCQGYSTAGARNVMDPRNSLVFEFMRIVIELKPHTFIMENVPGIVSMLTPEGVPVVDAIARIAADGGFGTYDAIRRSLLSHPDARAAVRTTPVGRQRDADGSRRGARGMPLDGRDHIDLDDAVDQLDLFAECAS